MGNRNPQLEQAVKILQSGGLVIVPTETFYGIACDAMSVAAVRRLVGVKSRQWGKPIPLIAGSIEAARSTAAAIPPLFEELAARFWPGPLTLVVPAAGHYPGAITGGTGSVGIRMPGPSPALELARAFGRPVTATSANPTGQPPPRATEQIDPDLAAEVDLVVDGGQTPGGEPSTVLDLTGESAVILRPGPLQKEVADFLSHL